MTMTKRRECQREKILALLQAAGAKGVTNIELNGYCMRFGARLWELRKQWDIDTVRESETIFRFILKGRKAAEQLKLIA
jgi:hypothetical protein